MLISSSCFREFMDRYKIYRKSPIKARLERIFSVLLTSGPRQDIRFYS
ncbi:MAG: hypothetical protein OP8BY_0713 [Candidatus Saccharicenans subterraneus]|uniref:Uncharacterized protein n=1 Tax=Candidatus Saccharicenans subterraneus TaxID=2508984 RepID=A0A3E2BKA1_9BACT|nr:MAG: hypothetical protein OP8BY_0713 [Candidatus Saccharicenans subterraneum]